MFYFLANIPEIKIRPDVLFQIGPVGITNSMMALLVVNIVLLVIAVLIKYKGGMKPTRLQVAIETVLEFFMNTLESAFGNKEDAKKFFPLIFSLFLAIFVANQFSILPLLGELNIGENGLFRVPTSDFSLPIALALLVVVTGNIIALATAPFKHIGNFIKIGPFLKVRSFGDFFNAGLEFFLGLLDIIGEIAKVVSLSARLFGNVFAGELMVLIITYLASFTAFLVPIPFIFLSIFSGVIHAFVFPLLSVQYLAGTINSVKTSSN